VVNFNLLRKELKDGQNGRDGNSPEVTYLAFDTEKFLSARELDNYLVEKEIYFIKGEPEYKKEVDDFFDLFELEKNKIKISGKIKKVKYPDQEKDFNELSNFKTTKDYYEKVHQTPTD
jgi:hypothetical protein